MCLGIFKKKKQPDMSGLPTLTKKKLIEEMEYDILIHEYWAVKVTEEPAWAPSMGDYDWHMRWIEVYRNVIFYLQEDERGE